MNGIICLPCLILAILALLPAPLRWQNELNKNQEKDVSQPNRDLLMNLTARTPSFVSSSASSNPERTSYGYQDPERYVLDDRTGQPVETSRSDFFQKDYGRSWSSQEWKSGAGERDRSGKPEENSWDSLQDVDPHREEYLLGRTAHSARYEETFHDRTGQLVPENLQGKAHFENFIMGSEVTEFVNQVRDQVRIRQKRMSSIAENCAEHSIIWWMFMAKTLNAATFMGKHFSTIQKWLSRIMKVLPWNRCSMSLRSWWITRRKSMVWTKLIGKRILGNVCHWLVMKQSSIFKAQKSTYSQILCYVSAKFSSTSWMQRSLEEQSCRGTSREKLQRLWCYQWRVDRIRVEHFPRIHNVAALW